MGGLSLQGDKQERLLKRARGAVNENCETFLERKRALFHQMEKGLI